MPLDQAIYSAAQDKIFGVRGKWIYQFNATTGVKENEFRFVDAHLNDASIVEMGGFLYASAWRSIIEKEGFGPGTWRQNRDIFKVDYALTTSTPTNVVLETDFEGGDDFEAGFANLVTDGTLLYGLLQRGGGFFKVDPSNVAATYDEDSLVSSEATISDFEYQAGNGVVWVTSPRTNEAKVINVTNFFDIGSSTPAIFSDPQPFGITYCPSNGKAYAVTGTDLIVRYNAEEALATLPGFLSGFTYSTLSVLEAAAKPIKIKYNAVDGLIYVPTWANDTVEVLDPATDTIVAIKTGFTDPYDVVFTPTKKWAVQNSGVGLKEIV